MNKKVKDYSFYHSKIKDWPEDERPREKLFKYGCETLSDAELLAILIQHGTGNITALDIAKSLLIKYKDIYTLSIKEITDFREFKGIGFAKGIKLIAAFEIGRRIAAGKLTEKINIKNPKEIASIFIPRMEHLNKEQFKIIMLNSGNQIKGEKTITKGILNASLIHAREVFRAAILESSAGIILLHNHPSGNPAPSKDDIKITKKLVETGKIMDIPVKDHIIVAGRKYFSFIEHGLID